MKWMHLPTKKKTPNNSSINLSMYNGCSDALWEPASGGLQTGVSQSQSHSGNCPEWDAALKLGPSLSPCTCFYYYIIFLSVQKTQRETPGSFLRRTQPEGLQHQRIWPNVQISFQAPVQPPVPKGMPAAFESPLSSLPSPCVYNAFLKTRLRTGWYMTGVLISSPHLFTLVCGTGRRDKVGIMVWNEHVTCSRGKNLVVPSGFTATDSSDWNFLSVAFGRRGAHRASTTTALYNRHSSQSPAEMPGMDHDD